jgi:hypothetical protein
MIVESTPQQDPTDGPKDRSATVNQLVGNDDRGVGSRGAHQRDCRRGVPPRRARTRGSDEERQVGKLERGKRDEDGVEPLSRPWLSQRCGGRTCPIESTEDSDETSDRKQCVPAVGHGQKK